jgi:hypothetical protein
MNPTVWYYLGLLVLLVALCAGIAATSVEGFNVNKYYTMATTIDRQIQPGATNSVFTNYNLAAAAINPDGINAALQTPDLYSGTVYDSTKNPTTNTLVKTDYSALFTPNPIQVTDAVNNEFCKNALSPRDLPTPGIEAVRCGWSYVDDDNTPSKGTIGTHQGPLVAAPPNSVWYWNLTEAAKKEDIKYCRKLTDCSLLDTFNGSRSPRCGFCKGIDGNGRGVPVNSTGAALYPEATCDTVIKTSSQCTPPDQGAGADPSLSGATDVCDNSQKGSDGTISRPCQVKMAKMAGMNDAGAFIRSVQTGWSGEAANVLNVSLASYKLPDMFMDHTKMLQYCLSIVNAQAVGATEAIRNYATYLAGGQVDVCPTQATTNGPFDLMCMQRKFRESKCQPAGSKYPKTSADATATALMTWGDLNAKYTGYYNGMSSSNANAKATAIKQCLGVDVPVPLQGPRYFVLRAVAPNGNPFVYYSPGAQVPIQFPPAVTSPSSDLSVFTWRFSPLYAGAIMFGPYSDPTRVFRHQGFKLVSAVYSATNAQLLKDAAFYVRPGKSDSSKIRFEAALFPNYFLRHYSYLLVLNQDDGSPSFQSDCTFTPYRSSSSPLSSSKNSAYFAVGRLQSYNFPDRYVTIPAANGTQAGIEPSPSGANSNLTWTITVDGAGNKRIQFKTANGTRLFRHSGFKVSTSPVATDALTVADSTFFMRTSRANPADTSRVSFESVNFPNKFIRHTGFKLFLQDYQDNTTFKNDCTFAFTDAL